MMSIVYTVFTKTNLSFECFNEVKRPEVSMIYINTCITLELFPVVLTLTEKKNESTIIVNPAIHCFWMCPSGAEVFLQLHILAKATLLAAAK